MSPWILFGIFTGLVIHTIYPYQQKGGLIGAAVLAAFGGGLGVLLT